MQMRMYAKKSEAANLPKYVPTEKLYSLFSRSLTLTEVLPLIHQEQNWLHYYRTFDNKLSGKGAVSK